MAKLKVLIFPDERLREKAKLVDAFDSTLTTLAQDMFETMYAYNGIGLASVQVGVFKRLFVLDVSWRDEDSEGAKAKKNPRAYANPEIVTADGEVVFEEGCLSVPRVYGEVARKELIHVRYQTIDGKTVEEDLEGIAAIAFQHELDHLDGVLFFDHLSTFKRRGLLERFTKLQLEAVGGSGEKEKK